MLNGALARIIANKTYAATASKGWKTPISEIIGDDFILQDEWATRHMTLEDAASHRTGLPRHDFSWITANDSRTVPDIVRNLRNLPPTAEPRETFQYCNLMYIALTEVLEKLTGTDWWSAASSILFRPLGMKDSYDDLQLADKSARHVATGYFWDNSTGSYGLPPRMNFKSAFGAGAMISTVDDYLKWVRYAMGKGAAQDEFRKVRTPLSALMFNSIAIGYALGWEHGTIQGKKAWFHGGTTSAHAAEVYWVPELEWGFVSFCNTGSCNAPMESIAFRMLEEKLRTPAKDRHTPPSVPETPSYDEFVKAFYPDVTDRRLPSPLAPEDLVGTYHDAGYGSIKIQLDAHQNLVGLPVGMEHDFLFEHVSGEYWMAMGRWPQATSDRNIPMAAQFITGVDGKADTFVLSQSPPGQVLGEVTVNFKRSSAEV